MNKPSRKSLFTSVQSETGTYFPPSWQQHENVVLHLSQLSQNVLLVIAPQEGGKTTFLQHLLSKNTPDLHKVTLTAKSHTSVEALLHQVVLSFGLDWQGARQAAEQIYDLQQAYGTQSLGLLTLFIDDAHLLSNEQLQTLVQLINHQAQNEQQLRLVLLGEPSLELRMFSPDFTAISNNKIYTIELESWTLQDLQAYLGASSEYQFNKDQIAMMFERSAGLPGHVIREKMSMLEHARTTGKKMTKKPFKLWGFHPISLGVLAGLALGGSYLVINNLSNDEEVSIAPTNAAAQTAQQNWSEDNSPKKTSPAIAFHFDKVDTSDVIEDDMKQDQEEHSKSLSQTEPLHTAQPIQQNTTQIQEPQLKQPISSTEQEIAKPQTQIESKKNDNTATTESTVKVAEKPQKSTSAGQNKQINAKRALTKAETHLLAESKQHYTLQLLGASKEESIKQFVKKHRLEGSSYSFQTKRQGKDWYIVVYGNYASADKAKEAAKSMSENLKSSQIQPWVRGMGAIHKDIQEGQG